MDLPGKVLILAGPTASGKSAVAVELAETFGAEIVGADSRQIYRRMEVGTAKPTLEERDRVPHHLIDIVDPDEDYDAARWRQDALTALAEIHARQRRVIVCGGTGLYLRSLLGGIFEGPSADPALRASLEASERANRGSLHARLTDLDPETAKRVHPNDLMRTIRALEVGEITGKPLSQCHREQSREPPPFEALVLEIRRSREDLAARIDRRSGQIVRAGLVEELASLRRCGFAPNLKAFSAIGYREAGQCLDGELKEADLPHAVATATRRYAKRQRTWLRGQMDAVPLEVASDGSPLGPAERLAEGFFS